MARWLIVMALCLVACGPSRDDWPEGRPLIDEVRFIEQAPQNPMQLRFELDFEDTDRDLALGRLHLFLDDERKNPLPLADLFANQVPALANDVAMGSLEVFVEIQGTVDDGARVEVGFQIEDAAGRESNKPTITLQAVDN